MKNKNLISKIMSIVLVMICIVSNVSCTTVDTGKIEAERIEAERIEAERVATEEIELVEAQIDEAKNLFIRSQNNLITAAGEYTDDYWDALSAYQKAYEVYNKLSNEQKSKVENSQFVVAQSGMPLLVEYLEYCKTYVKAAHDYVYNSLKNPYTFEPKTFDIKLWVDKGNNLKFVRCIVEGQAENAFGGKVVVSDGVCYSASESGKEMIRENFHITSTAESWWKSEINSRVKGERGEALKLYTFFSISDIIEYCLDA